MIILDTTIVNVALPSIKTDLAFSESALTWVVNAYMLAFAGFLLLGGRLGDLYGHRKMFLIGLFVFTLASLTCGLAESQTILIAARAVQGLGGAIVSAIALSLIMNLFTDPNERARAMGFFGFIAAGGGAIGVFLGGLLTGSFDWHWNFLVNIPIGFIVFFLCIYLLPKSGGQHVKLDLAGAVTITASLMLAIYAIVNGNSVGWLSAETLGLLFTSLVSFFAFLYIEQTVQTPLVPLSVFRLPNVAPASIIGILWSAGMFSWFFLSALYLQIILHYTPMQVGLSFLGANIVMAIFSLGLSAKIVIRFGTKGPLALGMTFVAVGLLFFAFSPQHGDFLMHVLPGMLLLGLGAGLAFNPVLLVATSDVPPEESGLASGVLNTAFMMGGSLGLAILASVAGARTNSLIAGGVDQIDALLSGYHAAFLLGALFAVGAVILSLIFLHPSKNFSPAGIH